MNASTLLLRIMRSRELIRGVNRIEPAKPTSQFPDYLYPFVATASLLKSQLRELFIVDERSDEKESVPAPQELIDICFQLANELKTDEAWLMSEAHREQLTTQLGKVRLNVISSRDVVRKLIDMPQDVSDRFCRSAGTTLQLLDAAYRRRFASVFAVDSDGEAFSRMQDPVNLDERFNFWAISTGSPKPILLLGDRGSGKTWQLLRFCADQNGRHRKDPIGAPPALYISLHNWTTRWGEHEATDLYSVVSNQCPWLQIKWDAPMFLALLRAGRIILCLDGFDEIQRQPNAHEIQEYAFELFRLLPPGCRFVIASRTTLFDSFSAIARLETWPASTVGLSMDVLEMRSFSRSDIQEYLNTQEFTNLPDILNRASFLDDVNDPIAVAVCACFRHPGLLAYLQNSETRVNNVNGVAAIREMVEGALISFNLDLERTKVLHRDRQGTLYEFGRTQRVTLLGDLAWFLAERGIDGIDVDSLPLRLSVMYGIDSDALRRDIRSQTVFEMQEDPGIARMTFGIRYSTRESTSGDSANGSVAADYFLASYIFRRLQESIKYGKSGFSQAMRFLGSVELSPLCASLLGEMCESASQALRKRSLARSVPTWISALAHKGQYEVFAAQYRYLVTNLLKLGCLSADEARVLDPWSKVESVIQTHPTALPGYEMRLIPACTSKGIREWAGQKGKCGSRTGDAGGPFLIGLHEVTNVDFQRFVEDPSGSGLDWSVERVTRAGSAGAPQSPHVQRTNEYHLYYWDKDSSGRFMPHAEHSCFPVVYVSWFAALAFCDWISEKEQRGKIKELSVDRGLYVERSGEGLAPQYRLPTAVEWRWAAQGPFSEARYPWDLQPYPLPRKGKADPSVRNYREAAKSVALARRGRSKAVAYEDDFSVFGVAGLVGNVKEWVQDTIPVTELDRPPSTALVLGSTAHLDETSFCFEYFANLFPENTNPDVGFRVGRSLSTDELSALDLRQQDLAKL